MRLIFAIALILISLFSFSQDEAIKNLPKIEFQTLIHDFGEIKYGSPADYDFIFKNTGKGPLIIKNAKAS